MIPEEKFNRRPRGRQMAEICFQKAPGQDLAQKGRFPMIPEEKFNSRPRGRQMAEICAQKAPGQNLAQKGRFPMVPEGDLNCRPKVFKWQVLALRFSYYPHACPFPLFVVNPRMGFHMRSSMVGSPNSFVRVRLCAMSTN